MSFQNDSVAFSSNKDKILITCICGDISHGIVQMQIDPSDNYHYMSFYAVPSAFKFVRRLQNAIKVFRGLPINVDLTIHRDDANKIALWLRGDRKI